MMPTGQNLTQRAFSQIGKPYIYGYEVDLSDPDPPAFDCSELIQWVCYQEKVQPMMPDGAIYQMRFCRNRDLLIDIKDAIETGGALLFRISSGGNHVAFSRGDGMTIEARGKAWGVGSWSASGRGWTHAALVPGVEYKEWEVLGE